MEKVRVIGVPEHFNLPWHLALEEAAFAQRGIDLQWTDIPEGTGRMCQMLLDNETDLAVVLTEGVVKSIVEGNPSKIIQEYVSSPLQWGIHVAAGSSYNKVDELINKTVAISRLGSGSHLMAYVHAQHKGWDTSHLKFEIINNLEGAIDGLTEGKADYFIWEHFTTKPIVDKGVFRRLGDCPTPWPCFVIAATDKFMKEKSGILKHILEVINLYTSEFKQIPSIDRTLANGYGIQLKDVQKWLSITQWSQSSVNSQTIDKVQDTLLNLKLISNKVKTKHILASQITIQ